MDDLLRSIRNELIGIKYALVFFILIYWIVHATELTAFVRTLIENVRGSV